MYNKRVHIAGSKVIAMKTINVRETRERLSHLLDAVATGEEIVILRHGKPAARLTAPQPEPVRFLDRSSLRSALPPSKENAAAVVRQLRDEERY
ncbi:type II toxin-antitoxin system Phd/YefM family antitoxin [Thioalkalivibrio sulfidiphilus]|nr:type II toxin-antitoxin system prevent-host-death family antitoxin [Thioalkalivibrio sulfidiphilus]